MANNNLKSCDGCGDQFHVFDLNGIDDGSVNGKLLCYDCFEDACCDDEEEGDI